MENVRKPNGRKSSFAGGGKMPNKRVSDVASAAIDKREKTGGGDLVDPRLFYFRALLDGDRFFSGGGRF